MGNNGIYDMFGDIGNQEDARMDEFNKSQETTKQQYDQLAQGQKDLIDQWSNTQSGIATEKSQYEQNLINQQKEQTAKDYQKEQKAGYTDYQKANDQFGANAETMASKGLMGSGYDRTLQTSRYNAYQNRVAVAREGLQKANLNYDNAMQQARMNYDARIAEIAYTQLEKQIALNLDMFNFFQKQQTDWLNFRGQMSSEYYQRSVNAQNRQDQLNQFNQQMDWQKQQSAQEQSNWQKEYELALANFNQSRSSSSSSGGYDYGGYSSYSDDYGGYDDYFQDSYVEEDYSNWDAPVARR